MNLINLERQIPALAICLVTCYLLISVPFSSNATHIAGADLTYDCLGNNQYEVELVLYRDCDGIGAPNSAGINISSDNLGQSLFETATPTPSSPTEITNPCSSSSTTCEGGSATGIEKYVYRTTVNLPAAATDWVFSYDLCCRNYAITTGGGGDDFYTEATLDNVNGNCNTSPDFGNDPLLFFCTNQNSTYNHGVNDPDGDSLVYSLAEPKQSPNTAVNYNSPYSYTNPLNGSPSMTIDGQTGDLNVTPTSQEISILSVKVEEYRNGQLIGSVIRDLQVYVNSCSNDLPSASGIDGTSSYNTNACVGEQICFDINTSDNDSDQDLTLTWDQSIPGATFTTTGGSRPTGTFCWTPSTSDINNQNTFTVTVQDDACPTNGSQTFSYTIDAQGFTDVNLGPDINKCAASDTLTASVSGSGGPYSFDWSNGDAGQSIVVTSSGTYTVTASTPNGCEASDNVQVQLSQTGNQDLISWEDTIICGSTTLTIDAGSGFDSYNWSNGETSQTTTVNSSGTYSVTVTDDVGCQYADTVTVNIYSTPNVDLGPDQTLCQGSSTTLDAGAGFNSYDWSTGASSQTITVSNPNTYSVTVTDGNGCTASSSVTITQANSLNVSIDNVNDVSCENGSDGSIDISVNGGTPTYTYSWSNGDNTQDISSLTAGTYEVTVTDDNGCSATASAMVDQPSNLEVSVDGTTQPSCSNGSDGSVNISVSGGTPNYNFNWSNGSTNEDLTNVSAGTYSVTVTDDNGCTATTSTTLSQPTSLTISFKNVQNISCNGQSDGIINITASGGTPGYNYNWSDGSTSEDLVNVAAGQYTVTVTDDNGCQAIADTILTEPDQLATTINNTSDVSCAGANDGSISINVNNGTPPYNYSWSNGSTNKNLSGLSAGTYNVTVSDDNGCTATTGATINEPSALNVNVDNTSDVSCNGGSNGSIDISVNGGTPTYNYQWSNGNISQDLSGVAAGTYTVTVTDDNNCTVVTSATINEPKQLSISLVDKTNISCNGASDGAIDIAVNGGTPSYNFTWSNGSSSQNLSGIQAGSYQVTVTDQNNCNTTASYTLNQPPSLSANTNNSNVSCAGADDGSISITNTMGGTQPYEYSINGVSFQNAATFNNLSGGTYNPVVRDANGCILTLTETVQEPSPLQINVDSVDHLQCNGTTNGNIYITATGGTAGYSYQWSNSSTSSDLTGVGAGSYTVTVTDQNGCTTTSSATITEPPPINISIEDTSNVTCTNGNDGSININVNGGTPAYSYLWSDGSKTEDINGLTAGNYTVTVTDANGCTSTKSITLTEPAEALTMSTSTTALTCFGSNDGEIDITSTSGGIPPYSYSINGVNFQNSTNFNSLAAGSYNVIVEDANGCTLVVQDTVNQPDKMRIEVDSVQIPSCSGGNTGGIFITVSGGRNGYTYQWSNDSTSEDQTGLSGGTYVVTATDTNGCSATASVNLSEPNKLNATLASKTNVTCHGGSDGSIDMNVNGGTPPYQYKWNNGDTTEDLNGLTDGVYSVTISDNNGCDTTFTDSTLSFTITQPNPISFGTTINDVSCAGGNDGSITIQNPTGGTQPYQYSIDGVNYQMGTTFTNLSAGVYNVFMRDTNNCTHVVTDTVAEPAPLQVSIDSVKDNDCYNDSTGSIHITVSGGQGSYSYKWSNDSTTQNISGLSAGNYTVTVSDGNNCTATASTDVSQPDPISITMAGKKGITCHGGKDGAIDISVDGGNQPYQFNWSNGDTTQNISNLTAGTYTVTVIDNKNCSANKTFTLNQPKELDFNTSITDVSCAGAQDGAITVSNPSGGVQPYSYSIDGISFQSSKSFSNLSGGIYNVVIRDDNNCTGVVIDTIDEPEPLSVSIDSTIDPSCNGDSTGMIELKVSGGTPGYNYQWSNGATSNKLTEVTAGNYSVTVTDQNNCSQTASATLNQPTPIEIDLENQSDVTCHGEASGIIDVSINGGNAPYNYNWSNGSTNEDINGVVAGTYKITVTDQSNCTSTRSFTLNQPNPLSITTNVSDVSCGGANDGSIDITNTDGGTSPYHYSIDGVNYQSSTNFNNLSGGIYNVIVRDTNLCTHVVTDTINEPSRLSVNIDSTNNPSCFGETGDIYISVDGGTPMYNYQWSNGNTSADQTGLNAGSYKVTVTDQNGCTATASATLDQPDELDISVTNTGNITCNGGSDGFININVSGGSMPYSYSWSNGSVDEDPSNLSAGTYTLTVTDNNGCIDTQDVKLTQPSPLNASTTSTDVSCAGANDGSITINNVTGGTPPYQYSLDGVSFQSSDTFRNLSGGSYSIVLKDASNCTLVLNDTIDEASKLQVTIDSVIDPSCHGDETGAAYISVSGGIPSYNYNWSDSSTNQNLTNAEAGSYTVTITDSEGCSTTQSITLNQPNPLAVSVADSSHISCHNGNDGFIDISVNGGTEPYSFAWSNGPTTEDQSGLSAGTYELTVTDAQNCTATKSLTLSETAPLTLTSTSTDVVCSGEANGGIFVNSTGGGVPPYQYSLDGVTYQNANNFTDLSPGIYDVIVRDANSCTSVVTDTIEEPAQLNTTIDSINNVACHGDSTGDIYISVTGGVPGYDYNWSNSEGFNDQDLTAIGAGTYTVTVIDTNGCTDTASATVTQPGTLSAGIASKENISCNSGNDGRIDITVSGGSQPYSYSWNNGSTNQDLINIAAGTYTVTITDAKGCDTTINVTLTEPDGLNIMTSTTDVTCSNGTDGTLTVDTATGGTTPYEYSIDGVTFQNNTVFTGLSAGVYNVIVRDSNDCTFVVQDTIDEPEQLQVNVDSLEIPGCSGNSTGNIYISVEGGTPSYDYNWSNGSTMQDQTGLSAGTYTVTVTDTNNCTDTASITLDEPMPLNATVAGKSNISCHGGSDGQIDINVSGGTQPYSFMWSNGDTTEDISNVTAGVYNVTITDDNGCDTTFTDSTLSITLTEPDPLAIATTSNDLSCAGAGDGSISIDTVTGGVPPYQYSIDGVSFQTSPGFSNLNAGIYNVVVRDSNNCTHVVQDTVGEPNELSVVVDSTRNPKCAGDSTGSIYVTVNGGTPAYNYSWTGGYASEDLTDIAAGTYTVTLTDTNNCEATATATLTEPDSLSVSIANKTDVLCNGGNNGSIDISVNGGVQPYNYQWSNNASTEDLTNLTAGTYTVTITDGNGCVVSRSIEINEPSALTMTTSSSDVTCHSGQNGSISVDSVSGGTVPYEYSIDGINFQSSSVFNNLSADIYNVIVRDGNNCTLFVQDTIDEPNLLEVTIDSTKNVDCTNDSSGAIYISVSGGVPGYSYEWSNDSTQQDQTGLAANSYTVTVTDANGCTATESATVSEPARLTLNVASKEDITCQGGQTGSIDMTVTGGLKPYHYQWSNGDTNEDLNGVGAGTYGLTVTDDNGCTATDSIQLTEPDSLSFTTTSTDLSCNDEANGSISITNVTGGVSPYVYSLNNVTFQSSNTFDNLSAGIYNIIVKDANNCTKVVQDTVKQPETLQVTIDSVDQINCFGDSSGAIYTSVSGGVSESLQVSYQWSNDSTGKDITELPAGTYTVTVTDSNSCTATATTTINQPGNLSVAIASQSNVSCNEGDDGNIDITVSGGVQPYSYNWSNGSNDQDLNNVSAGTYTVTVSDANGCDTTITTTVTEPPALAMSTNSTAIKCSNGNDGSITIDTTSGGTPPYQYSIDGVTFQSSTSFNNLNAGVYNVIVQDANNCTFVVQDTIDEPAPLNATIDSINQIQCNGDSTGSIYISIEGGTHPYTYDWSNDSTTQNITGLGAGTYNVTVTDSNGCITSIGANLTEPTPVTIDIASKSDISCHNGSDGSIDITVTGGTQPYSYSWSNSATNEDINGLEAGTYTVTVTDNNNCSATRSITLTEPSPLFISTQSEDASCNSANDGSIFIDSTSGGTAPYQYSIDGVTYQNGTNFNGLSAGVYNVIVRDSNNCTFVVQDTIDEPEPLNATIDSLDQIKCNGDSTGSISINVEGGTPGYSYNWSNGATSQDLTGLPAKTYSVTVTDSNGCTTSLSTTLTEPTPINISVANKSNVSCKDGSDGAIDISVTGGTQPYSYSWSNSTTTEDINGIGAGTYTVTVTDNNNCTATRTITITEPSELTMLTQSEDVSCNGGSDGTIQIDSTLGGTTPYQYSIDGVTYQSSTTFTGLNAGIYNVIVKDSNDCTFVVQHTIDEPSPLQVNVDSLDIPGCSGNSTGNIYISVQGGTPGYDYDWSNGSTIQDQTGLSAGTYTVTVTDSNNCIDSANITLDEPMPLNATVAGKSNISCHGGSDGQIDINVNGGTQPYSFNWSNGDTTEDISNVTAGVYNVTITDANGCDTTFTDSTLSVTLTEPDSLTLETNNTDAKCAGASDGSITIDTVAGGVPPYQYSIDGISFQNATNFSNLDAGVYNVVVRDSNNCTHVIQDTVNQPTNLSVTLDSTDQIACHGDSTGAVYITPSGGTGTYTYQWSNNSTNQDQTNLPSGSYSVTVSDVNGCTATTSATINEPSPLNITVASKQHVSCNGGSDGSIDIGVSGGVQPYDYLWSNNSTNQDLNAVSEGTYTVTVTDDNGCAKTETVPITEPQQLNLSTSTTPVSCANAADGGIEVTNTSGGVPPYQYSIDGVNFQSSTDFTGVSAGIYNVIVTDSNNCLTVVTDTVEAPEPLTITIDSVQNVSCISDIADNGAVYISVDGGTPGYSYDWSNNDVSQDITGLSDSTYSVTVTDSNGCITTASATVEQLIGPSASIASKSNVTCNGGNDGSIDIIANGGTQPYTYNWSNGSSNQDLLNVPADQYMVTITDANGCDTTLSDTLTEPAPLTMTTTSSEVTCAGTSNGSIVVDSASGGVPPYEYSIDGVIFQSSDTFNNLSGGTYSVVVRDLNNCTFVVNDTVNQPDELTVAVDSVQEPACSGDTIGSIDMTVSGGTPGYTYSWNNGDSTEDLTNVPAGFYAITVTDANGCTSTASTTIQEPDSINISVASKTDILCNGGNNGAIDISVNGGLQPYSYLWSDSSTSEDLNGKTAGIYTVTVTDANGCTATKTDTLTEPDSLNMTTISTDASCAGAGDGSITITDVTGGTPPYSYSVGNCLSFTSDTSFTSLGDGIYNVCIRDSNNCTFFMEDTIEAPAPLQVNITEESSIQCHGDATGELMVTATGGASPYSYTWFNGDTTQTVDSLASGTYAVTVTDTNGCANVATATIQEPDALSVNLASLTNVSCHGLEDGQINVNVSGGITPYQYNWSNGDTTEDLTELGAGEYELVVEDANGCASDTFSATITEPNPLEVSVSIDDVTCEGAQDGAIDATFFGGNGGYNYQWSTGDTTEDLQGLMPGTYTLTLSDAKGCTTEQVFEVSLRDSSSISVVDTTYATCDTSEDGAIAVEVVNGEGPYTYDWSNNSSGSTIDSLPAGTYSVTATSSIGCTATETFNIGVKFDTCITQYPPVAVEDNDTTLKGEIVSVPVLENDYDPNGDTITVVAIHSYPDNGNVTLTPDDSVDYEPYTGFTGVDSFEYVICDPTGLCDTATVYINVKGLPEVFVPNGFSPNGDGYNDDFVIENLDAYDENELKIFNRWGNEVYRAENYENEWSGTRNGNPLPDATYYYILRVWDDEDQKSTFNGHVIIHRDNN